MTQGTVGEPVMVVRDGGVIAGDSGDDPRGVGELMDVGWWKVLPNPKIW